MDRFRDALRSRHYSRRTEKIYSHRVRRFIHFHNVRHPAAMAEPEINAFLTHLAVKENVSASTQNQAMSDLLFLYRHVIGHEVGDLGGVIRARKPKRLPVVLTRDEVKAVLSNLSGDRWIMASLMYGAGLRLMECLRLRVQDIEFNRNEIHVRDGKGAKDRITMLPDSLKPPLQEHLKKVKMLHGGDLAEGWGGVQMPDALDRKYPNEHTEWRWQWVFPQESRWKNTHFYTPLPRIFSKQVMTFEPFRNFWDNGCQHDHDLYPCPEQKRARGTKSVGDCFMRNWKKDCFCTDCGHRWCDKTDPARIELEDLYMKIKDKLEKS